MPTCDIDFLGPQAQTSCAEEGCHGQPLMPARLARAGAHCGHRPASVRLCSQHGALNQCAALQGQVVIPRMLSCALNRRETCQTLAELQSCFLGCDGSVTYPGLSEAVKLPSLHTLVLRAQTRLERTSEPSSWLSSTGS